MATNGNFSGLTAAQVVGTFKANNAVPVTLAEQLRGSLRTVASISEREAIPGRKLDNGMIVYVDGTNTYYTYKGGTRNESTGIMSGGVWSTFSSGSGGSASGAGLTEWNSTTDYAANDVVIYDGGFFFATSTITTSGTCSVGTHANRADCTDAGGVFTGTDNPHPEETGAPWTRIHLDNVEHWDGGTLKKNDGSSYTVSELITVQGTARDNLGGDATETIDGFMSSTDKIKLNDLPPTWVSGTTYSPTDQVSYDSKVYVNISGTSGSTTSNPSLGASASVWRQTGIVPSYSQDVATSNTDRSSKVTMKDSRTFVPSFEIAGVTTSDAGVMNATDKTKLDDQVLSWVTGTSYSNGDLAAYNGKLYKSVSISSQSGHQPDTDQGTCSVDNSTTRPACDTAGGTFIPIWEEIGVVDLSVSTSNTAITVRSSTGTNAVIPAANSSNAGAMTQEDFNQLVSFPQEWSSASVSYTAGTQVSFGEKLYSVLTAHTSSSSLEPTVSTTPENFVILSSTGVTLGTVDTTTVSISTSNKADSVTIPAAITTAAGVMTAADKVLVDTITNRWNTASVATAYGSAISYSVNDKVSHEGVVYISVSTTSHSGNTPSSTSTFWTEMIEYLESRDLGVFPSDPDNLRDGQVWYNSAEDLVKYFTLAPTQPTSETACNAADNGEWDSDESTCSGAGEINIVAHTATEFETTSTPQPNTPDTARLTINDSGDTSSNEAVKITLSSDGTAVSWFTGATVFALDFLIWTNSNPLRAGIVGTTTFSVSEGSLSQAQLASRIAAEITVGEPINNLAGLQSTTIFWNVNATVDPEDNNVVIFSHPDSTTTNLTMSLAGVGTLTSPPIGSVNRFSTNWTVEQTGVISNPDIHLAVAGQRIITGSLSTFTPSVALGRQAYIYLGTDYVTTASDSAGETELDPESHTLWTNITTASSGGGSGSGISLATADSLYYRQDAANAKFAEVPTGILTDTEQFYRLRVKDVLDEETVTWQIDKSVDELDESRTYQLQELIVWEGDIFECTATDHSPGEDPMDTPAKWLRKTYSQGELDLRFLNVSKEVTIDSDGTYTKGSDTVELATDEQLASVHNVTNITNNTIVASAIDYVAHTVYATGTEVKFNTIHYAIRNSNNPYGFQGAWVQPVEPEIYTGNEIVSHNGQYWINVLEQASGDVGAPGVVADGDGFQLWRLHDEDPANHANTWSYQGSLAGLPSQVAGDSGKFLRADGAQASSWQSSDTWADYAMGGIFVSETSITGGSLIELTYGGVSIFREIIESPYTDKIYSTNTSGVLSGLLSTRGA